MQVLIAFVGAIQAFLRLFLYPLGAFRNGRDACHQLFDRGGSSIGFFILLTRTVGHLVGAIRKAADAHRNLARSVAYLTNQLLEIGHQIVENSGCLTHFILTIDRQAAGEIAVATDDVAQAVAQMFQRHGDEMAGQAVHDDEQQPQRAECGSGNFQAEGRDFGFHGIKRNFHAHQPQYCPLRGLVTNDAILAEVVFGRIGRIDDAQEGMTVLVLNRHVGLTCLHDLLFECIERAVALAVRAIQLAHCFATGDVQILDDGELLDLVEEHFPLADCTGDHHAGQASHGHFVNALRKFLGLFDRRVAVDLRGPDNGTGPDQRQGKPDGSSETDPDFQVGKT